jgi:hypothetical protein
MAPSSSWPRIAYEDWGDTCDTLHAHTQVLGKLAATLSPPEPQYLHLALRLSARGWETRPLPAPDGSGTFVVAIDLRSHRELVEHSDGRSASVGLTPNRPVRDVTRELLDAVVGLVGPVELDLAPDEVPWKVRLDEDTEHATYDPENVAQYFAAASRAALVLAAIRAPYDGRKTAVNAWWGSFDLAVGLQSDDRELAVGWWPGEPKHPNAAFYAYAAPAPEGFEEAQLSPAPARWDAELGEFILDWDDVVAADDPHALALEFGGSARSAAGLE